MFKAKREVWSGGPRSKFVPPQSEIGGERKLTELRPREKVLSENIMQLAENYAVANNTESAAAARDFVVSQIQQKHFESEAKRIFVYNFRRWLLGKPTPEDERNTWWGAKPLHVGCADITDYIDMFEKTREEHLLRLKLLREKVPENLAEAYLYYKYIVHGRNRDPDGYMEDDYLDDFRFFLQAFQKNEDIPDLNIQQLDPKPRQQQQQAPPSQQNQNAPQNRLQTNPDRDNQRRIENLERQFQASQAQVQVQAQQIQSMKKQEPPKGPDPDTAAALAAAQRKITELETELRKPRPQESELLKKVAELETELRKPRPQESELLKKVTEHASKTTKQYEAEIARLRAEQAAREKSYDVRIQELERRKPPDDPEQGALRAKIATLEQQVQQKQDPAQMAALQNQLATLQQQLQERQQAEVQSQSQFAQRLAEIETQRQQEKTRSEAQITAMNQRLETMQQNYQQALQEREKTIAQLQQHAAATEQNVQAIRQELQQSEANTQQLLAQQAERFAKEQVEAEQRKAQAQQQHQAQIADLERKLQSADEQTQKRLEVELQGVKEQWIAREAEFAQAAEQFKQETQQLLQAERQKAAEAVRAKERELVEVARQNQAAQESFFRAQLERERQLYQASNVEIENRFNKQQAEMQAAFETKIAGLQGKTAEYEKASAEFMAMQQNLIRQKEEEVQRIRAEAVAATIARTREERALRAETLATLVVPETVSGKREIEEEQPESGRTKRRAVVTEEAAPPTQQALPPLFSEEDRESVYRYIRTELAHEAYVEFEAEYENARRGIGNVDEVLKKFMDVAHAEKFQHLERKFTVREQKKREVFEGGVARLAALAPKKTVEDPATGAMVVLPNYSELGYQIVTGSNTTLAQELDTVVADAEKAQIAQGAALALFDPSVGNVKLNRQLYLDRIVTLDPTPDELGFEIETLNRGLRYAMASTYQQMEDQGASQEQLTQFTIAQADVLREMGRFAGELMTATNTVPQVSELEWVAAEGLVELLLGDEPESPFEVESPPDNEEQVQEDKEVQYLMTTALTQAEVRPPPPDATEEIAKMYNLTFTPPRERSPQLLAIAGPGGEKGKEEENDPWETWHMPQVMALKSKVDSSNHKAIDSFTQKAWLTAVMMHKERGMPTDKVAKIFIEAVEAFVSLCTGDVRIPTPIPRKRKKQAAQMRSRIGSHFKTPVAVST